MKGKTVLIGVGATALTLVAIANAHNVVRYFWLNLGQDPRDWVPIFQHLPRVRTVVWDNARLSDYLPPTPFGNKLLVLQSYTKNIAEYADLSAQINKKYADLHGYDFKTIVSDGPVVPERSACWDKVAYVAREIDGHPWVLWEDSDAVVSHPEKMVEQIAASAPDTVDIFICTSLPLTKNVNTGVVLFRSTRWLKQFMDAWWNWPNKRWHQGMAHEQSALDEMLAKDILGVCTKRKVALYKCQEFNSTFQRITLPGKFIDHYRGCTTERRANAFKALLSDPKFLAKFTEPKAE